VEQDHSFGMTGTFKKGDGNYYCEVTNAANGDCNGVYSQVGIKHGATLFKNQKGVILCREYSGWFPLTCFFNLSWRPF
jgi:hypothetical protein